MHGATLRALLPCKPDRQHETETRPGDLGARVCTLIFRRCRLALPSVNVEKMKVSSSFLGLSAALSLSLVVLAPAQEGDKAGEEQKQLVPQSIIPPSPVLTPEQALKSFKLQPGFRIELAAAEPLVQDPVQIVFDPDGRLWVVELRGYMPDIKGLDESAPVGSIAVLEDTNGDGRMDKRTVFLDGLVMPRAISFVRDGVLVAEPPKLFFCRDTDGDLKCDSKEEVAEYAKSADAHKVPSGAVEHSDNGLMPALDNWIYSAKSSVKFRFDGESWIKAPTPFRGQWGISQDNFGRLVYNSNSDHFRVDLVQADYFARNPFLRGPEGAGWKPVKTQEVWPIRPNPGVNRGYREDQLRSTDWTLAVYTAACSPLVYRGDQFPASRVGDVFVCEPAGNLVRHSRVMEKDGYLTAENAYRNAEFLASTDERFRPVALANGPDGALYISDMYRGILQHRPYMTTYLRGQVLSRGLDKHINLGRIWRVVADRQPAKSSPKLVKAAPGELVAALSHPNGLVRDNAQRLLVERSPAAAVDPLKSLATTGANPLGRIHALWTLNGMGQLDAATALKAAKASKDPKVIAAAVRSSEELLRGESAGELLAAWTPLATHPAVEVRVQLALSLGATTGDDAFALLQTLARSGADSALVRDAVASSLTGREGEMIARITADKRWAKVSSGAEALLQRLAGCVAVRGKGGDTVRVLDALAKKGTPEWQVSATLAGLTINAPSPAKGAAAKTSKTTKRVKYLRVEEQPAALSALARLDSKKVREQLARLDSILVWPSKPGAPPLPVIHPLTADQQARFELGRQLYEATCAGCHQPHGFGQEGLAPPLADSEWVEGSVDVLARIVLHGARGPLTVLGKKWDADMPSFAAFDDEQVAAVLTYIRREWEHPFDPVEPSVVAKVRALTGDRAEAWTEAELKKVK